MKITLSILTKIGGCDLKVVLKLARCRGRSITDLVGPVHHLLFWHFFFCDKMIMVPSTHLFCNYAYSKMVRSHPLISDLIRPIPSPPKCGIYEIRKAAFISPLCYFTIWTIKMYMFLHSCVANSRTDAPVQDEIYIDHELLIKLSKLNQILAIF